MNKILPLFALSAAAATAYADEPHRGPYLNSENTSIEHCDFNSGSFHINTLVVAYNSKSGDTRVDGILHLPEGKKYDYEFYDVAREGDQLSEKTRKVNMHVIIKETGDSKTDDLDDGITAVTFTEFLKLPRNIPIITTTFDYEGISQPITGKSDVAVCVPKQKPAPKKTP